MIMMKIDDTGVGRCEILSNYKFRSAPEHPHFILPMVGDTHSANVAVPKDNATGKLMLKNNKSPKEALCSPLGDDGYITDSMSSMAGSLSSSWTERSHVYGGPVQGKATTYADVDHLYSRTSQSGTDGGHMCAGIVLGKATKHTDISHLYSRAAQSGVDRGHAHAGTVQEKATTHTDMGHFYSRALQSGVDRGHALAGTVQEKATTHTDISHLYSRAAQSGIDRGHSHAGTVQEKATTHTDMGHFYSRALQSGVDRGHALAGTVQEKATTHTDKDHAYSRTRQSVTDRGHVCTGVVQVKATKLADIDQLYSRAAQSGVDSGHMRAGTVQGKATTHDDVHHLLSRTAQSGIDRTKDVNKVVSCTAKMQLELSQDHSKSPLNSLTDSFKYLGHDTRRRDDVEITHSGACIEDMLGALTTIDEEIPGASNENCRVNTFYGQGRFDACTSAKIQQNMVHSPAVRRYKKQTTENPNYGRHLNYEIVDSDYYQPATISSVATDSHSVSPNTLNRSEDLLCSNSATGLCCRNGSIDSLVSASSPHVNGEGWRVYSRLLEKHFDIPPHNIDPAGRGKVLYSNCDDISDIETKRQVASFSPAQSLEERLKPTISGNRALRVSGSEFSLNRLGQNSSSYQRSLEKQILGRSESEFDNSGYSRKTSLSQPRHNHVRSSMPDLRYQDTSWLPERDSELTPRSFHGNGNRCHNNQQSQHENYAQSRDYPRLRLPQQLHASPAIMDQCTQTHRCYKPGVHIREYVHSAPPGNPSDSLAPLSYPRGQEATTRQHFHCNGASPARADKTSRLSGSSYDLATNNKPNDFKPERHSLDLCNIPQLQKQIRATSELCLQASRRHMFASSADIHKLFSGQIKAPKCVSSSSGQFWEHAQYTRNGLNSPIQRNAHLISHTAQEIPRRIIDQRLIFTASPSQVRTENCFRNPRKTRVHTIPLTTSLASGKDTSASPTLRQPIDMYPDVKRQSVQRKGSSCTEADTEQLLLQRQLSDYSSETELQLIESNAEAVKNSQLIQESGRLLNSSANNFMPIYTSIEKHLKLSSVHPDSEIEPAYANGPILAARISDVVYTPSHSGWFKQQATLPQLSGPSYINPDYRPALSETCGSAYTNLYFQSHPSSTAYTEQRLPSANRTTNEPARFQASETPSSSSSSNGDCGTFAQDNFNNHIFYPPLSATQNQTAIFPPAATSHSSPVHHCRQINHINQNLYTKCRTTRDEDENSMSASNPRFGYPVRQSASFQDFSVPYSNSGDFYSPASYVNKEHLVTGRRHAGAQEYVSDNCIRNGYSTCGRHSVLEEIQKLNFPFETNVMTEDEGDRLSTLV